MEKAKHTLKLVEKWTEKNKMKINKNKSGIMFYKKKNNRKRSQENNEIMGYPRVEEYKYLGIWIDSKMSFQK